RPVPLGVLLVLAGVAGASVNAASGRLVLGWFPPQRRGVAMGRRQTALPLGIAVAGVLLPPVAQHGGLRGAFLTEAGICLLAAGKWSDVVGSRLVPMRRLAYVNAVAVGLLALGVAVYPGAGTVLLLVAAVVTVSGNGLAFTAVAELAGPAWAGRALGAHNTVQNLAAAGTPALWGVLIQARGFGLGYAAAALFALVAAVVTPSRAEQRLPADPQHVARHAAGAGG